MCACIRIRALGRWLKDVSCTTSGGGFIVGLHSGGRLSPRTVERAVIGRLTVLATTRASHQRGVAL